MSERLARLREKAQGALSDPETQRLAKEVGGRIGDAAVDHVMSEFTKEKHDGTRKVRKLKAARAALRPVHTARKIAQGTAKAVHKEARLAGREAAVEHLSGHIPVQVVEDEPLSITVHHESRGTSPWDDEETPPTPVYSQPPESGDSPWGPEDPWAHTSEGSSPQTSASSGEPDYWK